MAYFQLAWMDQPHLPALAGVVERGAGQDVMKATLSVLCDSMVSSKPRRGNSRSTLIQNTTFSFSLKQQATSPVTQQTLHSLLPPSLLHTQNRHHVFRKHCYPQHWPEDPVRLHQTTPRMMSSRETNHLALKYPGIRHLAVSSR